MTDMIIMWIVIGLMSVFSVILLTGRGGFLIAGYNTSSIEKKAQYDEKKLCRTMGCGLSVITMMLLIETLHNFETPVFLSWLIPWGLFIVLIVLMILMNTICKIKA